ncbi:MAG TPA: ATP synthase F0 subunit B [Bacteroidetes bacterium]|nr:ATP synthase F0 subunit B [Bacteroidota bacterium]
MELLKPELGLIFWTAVIFLTVFFLLRKMAWKPILKALDDREKTISDSLQTAERTKQEMATMKSQHEALLNEARQERSAILKEAKDMKDAIINEARDKAKAEGARMIDEAKREIENQKMAAIIDVKNAAGELVLEVSEKILRRELSGKDDQKKYINTLIEQSKLN